MPDQPTVPYGHCHCGCGERTNLAPQTMTRCGWVKGEPLKFVLGHRTRLPRARPDEQYEVDGATGCWVWRGSIDSHGYGLVSGGSRGARILAHRFFYLRDVGPIPAGLELDHLCRNRACCNPAHLEPVTRADNVRRGAQARLTYGDVATIRSERAAGASVAALARRFGVSRPHVYNIVNRKKWRDAPDAI